MTKHALESLRLLPVIIGPTASGKTALSIELAEKLQRVTSRPAEIINADAFQAYKRMNIGTAKPTPEQTQRIRHHLIDVFDPTQDCSVAKWKALAEAEINRIQANNGIPIVCGGSHMYINALLSGLVDTPAMDKVYREQLEQLASDDLHAKLMHLDPQAAERLHVNDRKRVVRAIELVQATGKPLAQVHTQWNNKWRSDAVVIALDVDRPSINSRINYRVNLMIEQGLEDEVYALWKQQQFGRNSAEAIGYRQFIDFFEKSPKYKNKQQVIEAIKIRSRQYATTQRTWLKRMRVYPQLRNIEMHAPALDEWKYSNDLSNLDLVPSLDTISDQVIKQLLQP